MSLRRHSHLQTPMIATVNRDGEYQGTARQCVITAIEENSGMSRQICRRE
jgi:hypothetical protein